MAGTGYRKPESGPRNRMPDSGTVTETETETVAVTEFPRSR